MLKTAQGFSLLETLIAMAAGVLVLVTCLSLFVILLVSGNTSLQLSRLNQELQSVGDMISRDLQRAGFHPHAVKERALDIPAPSAVAWSLLFKPAQDLYPSPEQAHCVRIKFWEADAPAGEQAVVKIYHFQVSSGMLRLYIHHDPQSTQLLSALCGLGNQLISSKEIQVTELFFRLTPNSQYSATRSVEVEMSAAHVDNPALAQTLYRRVLLRNQGQL